MKNFKGFIIGIISTLIVTTYVYSIETYENIVVQLNTINVKINENDFKGQNILYHDRTYVPLRAIAEIVDKNVIWDGTTNTAHINDKPNNFNNNTLVTPTPTPFISPTIPITETPTPGPSYTFIPTRVPTPTYYLLLTPTPTNIIANSPTITQTISLSPSPTHYIDKSDFLIEWAFADTDHDLVVESTQTGTQKDSPNGQYLASEHDFVFIKFNKPINERYATDISEYFIAPPPNIFKLPAGSFIVPHINGYDDDTITNSITIVLPEGTISNGHNKYVVNIPQYVKDIYNIKLKNGGEKVLECQIANGTKLIQ